MDCLVLGLKDGCKSALVMPFGVILKYGQRLAVKEQILKGYQLDRSLVVVEKIKKATLKSGWFEHLPITAPRRKIVEEKPAPVAEQPELPKKAKTMAKSSRKRTKKKSG